MTAVRKASPQNFRGKEALARRTKPVLFMC